MIHTKRTYCLTPVPTPEELAEKLTDFTWTLCTGFEIGGYLFLNDSFSENGAQEYAVIRKPPPAGEPLSQVKSITFSWCRYEEALEYIRRTLAGEFDAASWSPGNLDGLTLQPPGEHRTCPLCA